MVKQQGMTGFLLLILGDMLIIIFSYLLALYLYMFLFMWTWSIPKIIKLYSFPDYLILLLPIIFLFWSSFISCHLYSPMRIESFLRHAYLVCQGSVMALVFFITFTFFAGITIITKSFYMMFLFLVIPLLIIFRLSLKMFLKFIREKGYNFRNILVVGTGEVAYGIAEKLQKHQEFGLKVVGYIDDEDSEKKVKKKILGSLRDIPNILHTEVVDEVIFATPFRLYEQIEESIRLCELEGVMVRIVTDIFKKTFAKTTAVEIEGIPILTIDSGPSEELKLAVKRAVDIIVSLVYLTGLFPLFLLVAILIKIDSKGHVLFKQVRVGLNGRRFLMLKFRSMRVDAEKLKKDLISLSETTGPAFKMKKDPRVTRVGRIIRKLSIDELPQLWNVLKGEMSLIGPRPPLSEEVKEYDICHRRRLSMRPGITCIWQVSGRSNISFEKWMEMDLEYIDNWSLWLDLKILLKTVVVVLKGTGAY
ncbi:sugar transferase [bacterium]|nr:sugar transferase [bacterium]